MGKVSKHKIFDYLIAKNIHWKPLFYVYGRNWFLKSKSIEKNSLKFLKHVFSTVSVATSIYGELSRNLSIYKSLFHDYKSLDEVIKYRNYHITKKMYF